jgi:regulator of protease activity HflC (stomatin/prohibitin superfamily)
MAARSEDGVGARVQDVLDSATRAADEIRAEAEGEGARILAEARREAYTQRDALIRELLELRESLSVRAREVERQAGELQSALTAAIESMSGSDREGGLVLSPLSSQRPPREPVAYPGSGSRGKPFRPRT